MRVKIQARNSAGLFQDILIDPGKRNMLAMDFSPRDLYYLTKRGRKALHSERLHLGCVPMRIKTRVTGPNGKPLDIVADRTVRDWIAFEVTREEINRLTATGPGKSSRLIVYAGPKGNRTQAMDIELFKSEWPPCGKPDENVDYERGMALSIAQKPAEALAFMAWVNEWPLNFHSTEKAEAPKLVLPDDKSVDVKDH